MSNELSSAALRYCWYRMEARDAPPFNMYIHQNRILKGHDIIDVPSERGTCTTYYRTRTTVIDIPNINRNSWTYQIIEVQHDVFAGQSSHDLDNQFPSWPAQPSLQRPRLNLFAIDLIFWLLAMVHQNAHWCEHLRLCPRVVERVCVYIVIWCLSYWHTVTCGLAYWHTWHEFENVWVTHKLFIFNSCLASSWQCQHNISPACNLLWNLLWRMHFSAVQQQTVRPSDGKTNDYVVPIVSRPVDLNWTSFCTCDGLVCIWP